MYLCYCSPPALQFHANLCKYSGHTCFVVENMATSAGSNSCTITFARSLRASTCSFVAKSGRTRNPAACRWLRQAHATSHPGRVELGINKPTRATPFSSNSFIRSPESKDACACGATACCRMLAPHKRGERAIWWLLQVLSLLIIDETHSVSNDRTTPVYQNVG